MLLFQLDILIRSKHIYRVTTGYWVDSSNWDQHVEESSSSSLFYNWDRTEDAGFQDTLQKYDMLTDIMNSQPPGNFIHITLAAWGSVGLLITDLCCSNLLLTPLWMLMFINWRSFVIRVKERNGAFHSGLGHEAGMPGYRIAGHTHADTIQSHTPRSNIPSAVTKWVGKKKERNKNPLWWLLI